MKKITALFAITLLIFTGCKKDNNNEIDTEYPEILTTANSSPLQCGVLTRGQTFTFKATFSDNKELGAYSLDIHHNFDHHNHSTEVNQCTFDAKKTPVKPFLLIQNYDIPTGSKRYEATAQIVVPADVDPGDYHFMIRLTDKEGWQTIKGLSIKVQ
ncbi:hypothetical protein D3C87_357600 [compost metagenome]